MKTKRIKARQGFTIVELVIVIGVIGVLAGVLIPTFINLNNKANEASNQAFVKNLNTQMAIREQEEGKNSTMFEAVEDAKDIGFDVEKLTPVNGRDLVWDSVSNRFALVNPDGTVFYSDGGLKIEDKAKVWKIASSLDNSGYSIYAKKGWNGSVDGLKTGFDAGYNTGITQINYTGSASNKALIRGYGEGCVITINASNDDVDFYGFAKKIDVKDVKNESLHIYGSAAELEVTKGHVKVEDTGIVFKLSTLGSEGSVTNGGYVGANATGKTIQGTEGGDYKIGSLAQFEAFRDTVNAGNNFAGINVVLTSDITLHDGWKPIGEGSRKVGSTVAQNGTTTIFAGNFDGGNKTISGLNNKNFVPTSNRLVFDDGANTYAYGLFALVEGANIKNVTLSNVDIDTGRYEEAVGDSVGALVGFSTGNTVISNVKVSGTVSGYDAVGGILGRGRGDSVTISDCKNSATIGAVRQAGGIAGQLGETRNGGATLTNCSNEGSVATRISVDRKNADAVYYWAAGIANLNILSTDVQPYTIRSCTNKGTISTKSDGGQYHEIGRGCFASSVGNVLVESCTLKDGTSYSYTHSAN